MYFLRLRDLRVTIINIEIMANPDNIAPMTKYGGKIVECHPGKTDTAKSMLTIE